IFVDGMDIGDPADVALRDRRMLSSDGIFVVVATISEQDGSSVAEPEVIFRGVPYPEDAQGLLDDLRDTVDAYLARAAEAELPYVIRAGTPCARRDPSSRTSSSPLTTLTPRGVEGGGAGHAATTHSSAKPHGDDGARSRVPSPSTEPCGQTCAASRTPRFRA